METKDDHHSRTKDLRTLPVKQLLGSLIIYEMMFGEDQTRKKGTDLKAITKKGKKMKMRTWPC